jgi:hypothetical protein
MYLEPILNTSSSQMGLQKESNQFILFMLDLKKLKKLIDKL